jgi:hypothetical protein
MDVPECPVFPRFDGIFSGWDGRGMRREIVGNDGGHGNSPLMPIADCQMPNWRGGWEEIARVYIQVQKVYVLYLFLKNLGIFLKKF